MAINQDISNLPTPPSRSDSPSDFSDKADSFLGSLPTFQSELNTYADQLNSTQSQVNTSESNAEASAQASAASADTAESFSDAAIAVVNAELWDSATVYNETDAVVGSDGNTYRSLINSNVGNNPVNDDGTKWRNLTSAEKATLTKTFISGEEVSLALSSPVPTAPVVSATKEVPQVGVTNNSWDVAPDGSNFTLHDTAYSTTLTPSDASADGTFTLGTGSFATEDVGKKVVGNGGVAFLTATDGSYSIETAFNDTSTIAAGDWSMFALDVESAAAGLTLSGFESFYSIAGASYTGNSTSVGNDSSTHGVDFKPDGTRMYTVGQAGSIILQYDLSTAWDITSSSYSGLTFSVSSQDTLPVEVFFRQDGLKMYVSGASTETIYEYNLSTAWDITTASYSNNSFYTGNQIPEPLGLYFKSDGTKMFVSERDEVAQYNLSSAWDVSSATYDSSFFSSSEIARGNAIFFKPDGSFLYILDKEGEQDVVEYSLSALWDVTTATYTGNSFPIGSQESTPEGLNFRDDGSSMYVTGRGTNTVYQYSTVGSSNPTSANHTAITSASTNTEFWTDINSMTADDASNDGAVYYAVSTDDRQTWKIIDDAEGAERVIVRNNAGTWEYNDASDYGTETWVAASENDEFYALEEAVDVNTAQVTTGFSLENASYDNVNFDLSGQGSQPQGLFFKPDGSKMFFVERLSATVYEYDLSINWDISSASYSNSSFSVTNEESSPRDISFKTDGTKMYIIGNNSDTVFEYNLSNAWDLSSASYNNNSFSVFSEAESPFAIFIRSDGLKMYVADILFSNDIIYQYDLSVAWDITTASYSNKSVNVNSEEPTPQGIFFNPNGKELFLTGSDSDSVHKYDLSIAWDISTATYSEVFFDLSSQDSDPTCIFIGNNGLTMYISGVESKVFQYTISSATSANRMDATQLNAVSDANHYTLGDDLDLAVTLTMPDSGSTSPTSDGVSINYDAQVKNAGAILGTDYEWDRPNADTVNFKALSNENFKIRVI